MPLIEIEGDKSVSGLHW